MAASSKNERSHIEQKTDFPNIFASCNETGSLVIVTVLLNLTSLFSFFITYYLNRKKGRATILFGKKKNNPTKSTTSSL